MSAAVVRFADGAGSAWGVLRGDRVVPLAGAWASTADFLADGAAEARALPAGAPAGAVAFQDLRVLSPVTHPCRIVAQGANYRSHLREVGMDPDAKRFNMLFRKSSAAIVGPTDAVVRPPHVRLLDYEVELGLVIGKPIRGPLAVDDAALGEWIGGLVVANDVSARDVQLPQTQFYKGKSYRTFCPVGPVLWLPDAADFAKLRSLRLTLAVNGAVRQDGTTDDMVYGAAETLTEISALEDLDPGDLVLTGTPGGVALRPPPWFMQRIAALLPDAVRWRLFVQGQAGNGRYLQPGDRVTASIRAADGTLDLGTQETPVA